MQRPFTTIISSFPSERKRYGAAGGGIRASLPSFAVGLRTRRMQGCGALVCGVSLSALVLGCGDAESGPEQGTSSVVDETSESSSDGSATVTNPGESTGVGSNSSSEGEASSPGDDTEGNTDIGEDPETPTEEPAAQPCTDRESLDDVYAAVADDLASNAGDAPFLRYASLATRINQGACPADLELDRRALTQALNSLSTSVGLAQPEPINESATLYRIDLRDVGWDLATTVEGVAFEDKWEAIIAESPYAVELEGDRADFAKSVALTAVPVLSAEALIGATAVGELYYALVEIPETAFELFAQLDVDFGDVVRAGTTQSVMSRQDALIQRLDVGAFRGFYWSRFDVADQNPAGVVADPLGFPSDVIPSLFTLPNGLLGFALFDAQGARITETPLLLDPAERDVNVRNSVSCSGCHFAGVLAVTDEVRPYVDTNPFGFDADTVEEVRDTFLAQQELNEVIQQDNELYAATLARVGLDGAAVDPLSSVYRRFDGSVTLEVAAAELGVTANQLVQQLPRLRVEGAAALSALEYQAVSRAQFDAAFVAALCALQSSADNRPVAQICDAVVP